MGKYGTGRTPDIVEPPDTKHIQYVPADSGETSDPANCPLVIALLNAYSALMEHGEWTHEQEKLSDYIEAQLLYRLVVVSVQNMPGTEYKVVDAIGKDVQPHTPNVGNLRMNGEGLTI